LLQRITQCINLCRIGTKRHTMKIHLFKLTALIFIQFIVLFYGCGGGSGGGCSSTATLQSISVTPATPSIAKSATRQLTATATYSNGTSQDITASVVWSSNAPTVVTVDASGLATGVNTGKAKIIATSGTISGSTLLTVRAATLQSITVRPKIISIITGLTLQLKATGEYSDGTSRNVTSPVIWSSGAPTVVTVNASGLTTGVGVGTAKITATSGTKSGSISLTVRAATLQSITVRPMLPSVIKGLTLKLKAIGAYSDGTSQDITSSVIWSSGARKVATVNAFGLATAVHVGNAEITAISGIISGSTLLTVAAPTLQSITVASVTPSSAKSVTQQLTATAFYSDGTSQDITASVVWGSSAPTVVTVDASGLATGVNIGKAKIFATSGTISGSTSMTVRTRRAGRQWVLQTLWQ
jgi:uncharacterized protein YjdB